MTSVWVLGSAAGNSPTSRSLFDRAGSYPIRSLCCSCQIYCRRRTDDRIHLHLRAKHNTRVLNVLRLLLYRLQYYLVKTIIDRIDYICINKTSWAHIRGRRVVLPNIMKNLKFHRV